METPHAKAHLYYRVMCKMILLMVNANELSSATPEDMVYKYLVRDPTEIVVKDEAHSAKKLKTNKWRLIWSLSFSDNVICKLICGFVAKNAVAQFQCDDPGMVHTGIGVGHHDAGIKNLFEKIMALHGPRGGEVTTDDASNWDLSASRDGFILGSMIGYRAAAGTLESEETATAFQRLMYSYVNTHTARTATFG